MFILLVILALISLLNQVLSGGSDNPCKSALDRGNSRCGSPNKGIKWFYDGELDDCFEYYYEGCGGGQNSFEDRKACRRECIPADKPKCGGNAKSTGSCSQLDKTCPKGSKCDVGPMGGGICCDAKNEEEWDKEKHPKCKQGTLSKRTEWFGEVTRFGKSCSHKFCPSGYKCIQTKRLAHCCSEH